MNGWKPWGKSTFLQRPARCHASRCEAQSSSLLLQCCSAAVSAAVAQTCNSQEAKVDWSCGLRPLHAACCSEAAQDCRAELETIKHHTRSRNYEIMTCRGCDVSLYHCIISPVCMGSAVERWGVLEMVASCLLISPLLPTLAELVPGGW